MRTPHFPLRSADFAAPAALSGLAGKALGLGVLGAAASVAGFFLARAEFFQAYLVGWLLWYTVAAGCLGFLLLQHISGGAWGLAARRIMEAAARTFPFLAVAAIPLFLGLKDLFLWADPAKVAADEALQHKAVYLNPTFFIARTLFAIALFSFFAYYLSAKSRQQETSQDPQIRKKMHDVSAVGFLLHIMVNTFIGFDWLMSLDPHWFSSLYGAIFVAGAALAAMTFIILVATWLREREPMDAIFSRRLFHDYGKLLFACVMFWTYLSISQFIIMYQGNLPEEAIWFNERFRGGWGYVAAGLLIFHFLFPFLILLSRSVKRKAKTLAAVAGFVLVMRYIDLIWLTRPTLTGGGLSIHWLYLAIPVAIGGLWFAYFARELGSRPVLVVQDPRWEEILGHD
ncbi:MAG: hypothetical protein ABI639_09875 [Thermoanaerobaculia bacterium]